MALGHPNLENALTSRGSSTGSEASTVCSSPSAGMAQPTVFSQVQTQIFETFWPTWAKENWCSDSLEDVENRGTYRCRIGELSKGPSSALSVPQFTAGEKPREAGRVRHPMIEHVPIASTIAC